MDSQRVLQSSVIVRQELAALGWFAYHHHSRNSPSAFPNNYFSLKNLSSSHAFLQGIVKGRIMLLDFRTVANWGCIGWIY